MEMKNKEFEKDRENGIDGANRKFSRELNSLEKEDIYTGKNLGNKFASQYSIPLPRHTTKVCLRRPEGEDPVTPQKKSIKLNLTPDQIENLPFWKRDSLANDLILKQRERKRAQAIEATKEVNLPNLGVDGVPRTTESAEDCATITVSSDEDVEVTFLSRAEAPDITVPEKVTRDFNPTVSDIAPESLADLPTADIVAMVTTPKKVPDRSRLSLRRTPRSARGSRSTTPQNVPQTENSVDLALLTISGLNNTSDSHCTVPGGRESPILVVEDTDSASESWEDRLGTENINPHADPLLLDGVEAYRQAKPKWYQSMMKDPVHTGANLGSKARDQFFPETTISSSPWALSTNTEVGGKYCRLFYSA